MKLLNDTVTTVLFMCVVCTFATDVPANKDIEQSPISEVTSDKIPVVAVSSEAPENGSTESSAEIPDEIAILACGAAGTCHGFASSTLCHDRCKKCSGPGGRYSRGACCGWGWQTCCCYYS